MTKLLEKKYFILGAIFVIIGIISLIINISGDYSVIAESIDKQVEEVGEIKDCTESQDEFYVDVKGAVKNPGVYKVSNGMIVDDAIKLAGGITSKASTDNINLSKKLYSEMVIYVYTKTEIKNMTSNNQPSNNCNTVDSNSSSRSVNNDALANESNSCAPNTITGKVNINTASKDELLSISGIGESKAEAIIAYRKENKFTTIEDIKNVSGIGDAMFDKIKDYITV